MKSLIAALFLLLSLPAAAQQGAVKQSGNVSPGHPAMWTTNGVIQDGGTPANGALTGVGVTASGPGICQNSGPITGPYNQVCINATQTGGGSFSVFNNNGATGGFSFVLNGVTQSILVATPPLTPNDGACFLNNSGTIKDCGFVPLSSTGWTPKLPLIGSNAGGVIQGTLSGNTTQFATLSGAVTTNDCAKWDGSGNIVDAGTTCANNVSTPVFQIFLAPGAVTTLTLTNTPLPTASGLVQIAFDGRLQARDTWSINVVSGVITFNAAIPANVQVVEVDWFAPQAVAGVGSITVGASSLTGAVTFAAGTNVTMSVVGQTITVNVPTVVNTITNSDGTLTISPTGGNAVASINLGHANTWTANQAISLTNASLTISDSGNNRSIIATTNQGGNFPAIAINNGTGTAWQIYDGVNNAGIHFYNGSERFFIGSNGNVGVNTISPVGLLDVENTNLNSTFCQNTASAAGCTYAQRVVYNCQNNSNDISNINTIFAISGVQALMLRGTCLVNTQTNIPVNFDLSGDAMNGATVTTSSATANLFVLQNGSSVHDLTFTSSVTRTAGAYLYVFKAVNNTINRVVMFNVWDGLYVEGSGSPGGICPNLSTSPCSGVHVNDLRIYGPTSGSGHDCIDVFGASGSSQPWNTDVTFHDLFCTGANPNGMANGVEISTCGDCHIEHAEFESIGLSCSNADVLVDPGGNLNLGNRVESLTITASLIEGQGNGVLIQPTGGASTNVINIHHNWISSNVNCAAVDVEAGAAAAGNVKIDANYIINNADGIIYNGANAYVQIMGNYIVGSGTGGIIYGSTAGGFSTQNNFITSSGVADLGWNALSYGNSMFIGNQFGTQTGTPPTLNVSANNTPSNP